MPTYLEAALLELAPAGGGGPGGAHLHEELPPSDGDLRGRVGVGVVADARLEVHVAEHGQGGRRLHVLQGSKGRITGVWVSVLH